MQGARVRTVRTLQALVVVNLSQESVGVLPMRPIALPADRPGPVMPFWLRRSRPTILGIYPRMRRAPPLVAQRRRCRDSADNSGDEEAGLGNDNGAIGAAPGAQNGATPSYGAAREGVAIHFSKHPRKRLDTAHYGSSYKGPEAATDDLIRSTPDFRTLLQEARMNKHSTKPDTTSNSDLSVLLEIMQDQETKNPQLADKQRRLIEALRDGSSTKPQPASSGSAPEPPNQ